ncbi:MAG: T9SS type A sorting domain-containing protein [Flavobacteriales bacterium]|nr:T9SS type A sorting domain-containing protein [Flavobacteriales bacterium]
MRPTVLVIAALASSSLLQAQLVEVADQRASDVFYGRIIPVGTNWAVAARGNPDWLSRGIGHFVTAWNASGEEAWMHQTLFSTTSTWNIGRAGEMVPSPRGGLYLAGMSDACDILGWPYLMEVDDTGAILLDRELDLYFTQIAAHPTTHLALHGPYEALITDLTGDSITSWHYPFPHNWQHWTKAIWATDSTLFLTMMDGLVHVSITGNPIDTVLFDGPIQDMAKFGDDVLALTATHVHLLGADASLLGTAAYSAPAGHRLFAQGDEQGYFQAGNTLMRWQQDTSVAVVLEPETFPGQEITGMVVRNDTLFTASTLHQHGMATGLFRSYAFDGSTTTHDIDLEIDQVTIDTTWFDHRHPNALEAYLYVNVRAILRNTGTEVIERAVISHRTVLGVELCGLPSTRIELLDLALEPGAETELFVDSLMVLLYPYPPTPSSVEREVCLIAQSPNGLADREPANNISCAPLHIPMGLDERATAGRALVHPNPCTDRLTITNLPPGPVLIELFDATGRSVFNTNSSATNYHTLDLHGLNTGIYHLLIQSTHNRWTEKVVKADP